MASQDGVTFSRPFAVDRLAARGGETAVVVRAESAADRATIAARLRIPEVAALVVAWTLRPISGGVIEAEGVLSASVVQDCVVTLEPFEAPVAERFAVLFVPAGDGAEAEGDDDPDAPDIIPYRGRVIDLGEASVEQLALALDPFPRIPGAAFAGEAGDPEEDEEPGAKVSPFAALAARRMPPRDGES